MAIVKLVLDVRYKNGNGEHPVKFYISSNRTTSRIATNVFVKEADFLGKDEKYVKASVFNSEQINKDLTEQLLNYRNKISLLGIKSANMNATEIKKYLLSDELEENGNIGFTDYAKKQVDKYTGSSKQILERTIRMVDEFFEGRKVFFDDITVGVLRDMDAKWAKTQSINSRGFYFRTLRSIFNRAIDDELTTNYPFRKFKIKSVAKAKHVLPVETIRKLISLEFGTDEKLRELARDVFMLSFYLCGANLNDIYNWTDANYKKGKIVFVRNKIKRFEPEPVEITLQPEALAILHKYKGTEHLFSFADTYKDYQTFIGNVDKRIRVLRERVGFDELTMYYARYTWATIADKIGIDEKVISKSLGHTPTSVAGKFYITYDWNRTDEANRKVIDYVMNF